MNTFSRCALLLAPQLVLSCCGSDAGAAATAVRGPFAHENLQVWLVLGGEERPAARPTVPLQEALERKLVVVHETGDVNELAIENKAPDVDVYVQSGDIVQGGKQDRTIGVDLVLAPGSGRVPLPSFCVEQGRWSPRGGQVVAAGGGAILAAQPAGDAVGRFDCSMNNVPTVELKKAILLAGDQGKVWQEVAGAQSALRSNAGHFGTVVDASSPTSLELTMNTAAVQAATEAYVAALQGIVDRHPGAVGFAFAVHGRLQCADVYGSRALFQKLWPKLLRGAATAAIAGLQRDQPTPDVPIGQVERLLAACEPQDVREVAAGLTMAVGEGDAGHVVESRSGSSLVHRACLAK